MTTCIQIDAANREWVDEWTKGPWDPDPEAVAWIQSRPPDIKLMMLLFPPSCIVVANRTLKIPAPNTLGIITSYLEPDEYHLDGRVTVRQAPDGDVRAECALDWLTIVGYYKGLTPEVVANFFGPDWPRQQLLQLLRSRVACSYCKGWGQVYHREVPPKWGYDGFPMPMLGYFFGGSSATCPICHGTGDVSLTKNSLVRRLKHDRA